MSDWESSAKVVSSKSAALGILVLAWLIPGAGHLVLGRKKKAALLASIVILTFVLGVALQGKLYGFEEGQSGSETLINYLGSLAGLGNGMLYILESILGFAKGDLEHATSEIGIAFLLSAGLFNILTTVDAYRCAIGYDYDAAEAARKKERDEKKARKKAKAEQRRQKRAEQATG